MKRGKKLTKKARYYLESIVIPMLIGGEPGSWICSVSEKPGYGDYLFEDKSGDPAPTVHVVINERTLTIKTPNGEVSRELTSEERGMNAKEFALLIGRGLNHLNYGIHGTPIVPRSLFFIRKR